MTELLIDSMPVKFTLEESKDRPGKYIARGEFARSDRPTENKRLYKQPLWEREISRLSDSMNNRRVLGELDHPADGRTKLQRVSHLLTNLQIEGNQIIGETEIMDTPNGRILKAILDAGAQVGVSSRGFGTTKTIAGGIEEVQEDFRLQTFDFVADPATKTAYPQIFREELERIPEDGMELTLEQLKRDYPGLVEAIAEEVADGKSRPITEAVADAEERTEKRLREVFSAEVRRIIEKAEEAAREKALSEVRSDPNVAGAAVALENIAGIIAPFVGPNEIQAKIDEKDNEISRLKDKLAERELEVQSARNELEEMKGLAKKAAYQLHLERVLSDDESRDAIIALMGDVTQYESVDEMEAKVNSVREDLAKVKEKETTENDEHEARMQELESRIKQAEDRAQKAEEEKEKANDRTRRALEVAEEIRLKMYVENRVSGHESADTLKTMCESAKTTEDVDRIVDGYESGHKSRTLDEDQAEKIRRRVAQGKERSITEDTHGSNGSGGGNGAIPLTEFGLTEETFNKFAGTKSQGN